MLPARTRGLPGGYSMDRSDRIDSLFTKEQQEAAEARLQRLDQPLTMDQRGTARRTTGRLWQTAHGLQLQEVEVAETGRWRTRITIISREPLLGGTEVTLAIDRDDGPAERLIGRLEGSRPGNRAEDPERPPPYYTVFRPTGDGEAFQFR